MLATAAAMMASALVAPAALAQSDNAALSISDQGCGVLAAGGDAFIVFADTDFSVISTRQGHLVCRAEGVTNGTGRGLSLDYSDVPIKCDIIGVGRTTEWHRVISANGNATLTCYLPVAP
jgi:hypothetical protein